MCKGVLPSRSLQLQVSPAERVCHFLTEIVLALARKWPSSLRPLRRMSLSVNCRTLRFDDIWHITVRADPCEGGLNFCTTLLRAILLCVLFDYVNRC
jgi:hypothetical protein